MTKPAESLRVLLTDLIDYAGLFPPAALDMKSAVANYARYLRGEYAWMLGRFVLPAARLGEFEQALPENEPQPWRLSVLLGPKLEDDVAALNAFAPRCLKRAVIDFVETKVVSADEIEKARQLIGMTTTYFEIRPFDCAELLQKIHAVGGHAKIRTGGLTPDAIPPSDIVADFLMQCAKYDVPFKATAGLHHPFRCQKPLTYEPDAPVGVMHGFVNVFMLAAYLWASDKSFHVNEDFLIRGERPIVKPFEYRLGSMRSLSFSCGESEAFREGYTKIESRAGNELYRTNLLKRISRFNFEDYGLLEPFPMPTSVIAAARRNFAISFGSCSFEEPIADLKALNLL